ncbi:ammonium transporter 2 [Ciona intestinalis]
MSNNSSDTISTLLELKNLESNLDQFFLVICGIFILFMQTGFAFLEAGSVRSKNTTNIIMKNVLDLFIGAIMYFAVGYSFAYGQPGNRFIGHNYFFATNMDENFTYASWFFQYVFAATASTIVSGAMAERTEFTTYMVYCTFLTGFVYPVIVHWCWTDIGWLQYGTGTGLKYIDYAGSGVVHLTGGTAALVGAIILGPRIGRFNKDGSVNDLPGHTVTVAALGGFILFVGFMAFNGGSQLTISKPGDGAIVALSIMNTVLGGASGAIVAMLVYKTTDAIRGEDHYWSLLITINGGLTGMVSMCAGCNDMLPWAAVVIGTVAGLAFMAWHHIMLKLRIDDPLDAVAVHLGGGITGVLLAPIFVVKGLQLAETEEYVGGIIYGKHWLAFQGFGWNLLGAVAIIVWTGVISILLFGSMRLLGVLRVSEEVELKGLDILKHGEPAYPIESYCDGVPPWSKDCERANGTDLVVMNNQAIGNGVSEEEEEEEAARTKL